MRRSNLLAKLVIASFLAASGLQLAACNTVAGAGQDVKELGQGMQNTSENVREKM